MFYKRKRRVKRRTNRRPRRRYGRKTNRGRRNTGVTTYIARQPVPDRFFTKLHYVYTTQFNLLYAQTVPMTGVYQYRTSLFDPDYTSSGHQPMWHDQLNLLYAKYRVHGIAYKITCASVGANDRLSMLALGIAANATVDTTWDTLCERRDTRVMKLPPAGAMPATYKGYIPTYRTWGLSKKEFMADEQFIAYFGSNPTKTTLLTLYGVTNAGTGIVDYQIKLTYYVELSERLKVVGS